MARIGFVELPVAATDAAAAFYAAVFGWRFEAFGPTYACTTTGDSDLGLQADPAERCATILPVVTVADLAATQAAVEAAGGRVTVLPFAFPGGRRFHFRDPDGHEFAAMVPA